MRVGSVIYFIIVFVITALLFTSCQPSPETTGEGMAEKPSATPVSPTDELVESPVVETQEIPDIEPTHTPTREPTPLPPTERQYQKPEDGFTRILIDGDSSDWEIYPAGESDPVGDGSGKVDLTHSYAFKNDSYLYMLFDVEGEIGEYVQVDIDINPSRSGWPVDYMLSSRPYVDKVPHLNRYKGEQPVNVGNVGQIAQKEAFEIRIPLKSFEGPEPTRVRIRVMDGVCCERNQWKAVDETDPIQVLKTEELEPPFVSLADLTAPNSPFCKHPSRVGSLVSISAEGISVPAGYEAEYFIPPSGLNVPSDVVITVDGRIFIASSRANQVYEVNPEGSLSPFAESHAYALDSDLSGNLYGYDFPGGYIQRFSPDGTVSQHMRLPETACESTLAAAPDGTVYIGFNYCAGDEMGAGSILKIPPGGGNATKILAGIQEGVQSLDVISNGTLYAVLGNSLRAYDPDTSEFSFISEIPVRGSFHGLAVSDDGTAYISSGDFEFSGALYKVPPGLPPRPIAWFENNGLEGLALTPDGKILGTQRTIGGFQEVDADGGVRVIIEPNGLVSPHTLAFSPCGELVTVNDEAGGLTMAPPDGRNVPLIKLNSFQPPQTFLSFAPEGWYVTGESAPGFQPMVKRYLPNGNSEILAQDIDWVSGVAVGGDGSIYTAGTGEGTIFRILPDSTRTKIAQDLTTPQALAVSPEGVLYAITGGEGWGNVFSIPESGDEIISVTSGEDIATIENIPGSAGIAIGPDGSLFIPAREKVYRLDADGSKEEFAAGFGSARGAAFDAAGNLYVSDDSGNNIVRIRGFPQGTLRGTVIDASKGVLFDGADIRAVSSNPPFAGSYIKADTNGMFEIPLAPGIYTLTIWADGFQTAVVEKIEIKDGEETTVEVEIELDS